MGLLRQLLGGAESKNRTETRETEDQARHDRRGGGRATASAAVHDDLNDDREGPATAPCIDAEDLGFFSSAAVLAAKDIRDESQLVKSISTYMPDASREEVLFRYYLSRALYLGEFELPMLPQSAVQMMRLNRTPHADITKYARVVETDPSLVNAVIAMANSSFFASLEGAQTIEQSIVRIGLAQLERITLMHTFRSKLFRVPGFDDLLTSQIDHGIKTAIAAQVVAPHADAAPADAFLAGLFHDGGKLVLLSTVGKVQRKLSWQAPRSLIPPAFEAFHVAVGQSLCRHWDFPEAICTAVGNHHDGLRAIEDPLSHSVYVGNLIAHAIDDSSEDRAAAVREDPSAFAGRLEAVDIEAVLDEVAGETESYSSVSEAN